MVWMVPALESISVPSRSKKMASKSPCGPRWTLPCSQTNSNLHPLNYRALGIDGEPILGAKADHNVMDSALSGLSSCDRRQIAQTA